MLGNKWILLVALLTISKFLIAQADSVRNIQLEQELGFNPKRWQADSTGETGYRNETFRKITIDSIWYGIDCEELTILFGKPSELVYKENIVSYIYRWYSGGYVYLIAFETKNKKIIKIQSLRGCG